MNRFRLGVIGGMGPMAGIYFQKLIVESTPANKDQDHMEVICFTASQIPDRTQSLANDDGASYMRAVINTANALESAEVTHLVMPCHTAHARIKQITNALDTPFINMVEITIDYLLKKHTHEAVGLLGTDGTIQSNIYTHEKRIAWQVPTPKQQMSVMKAIYLIKNGKQKEGLASLLTVINQMKRDGVTTFLLACTELSLIATCLNDYGNIIDPLQITADYCVQLSR